MNPKSKILSLIQIAIGLSLIAYVTFRGNNSIVLIGLGIILCFLGINHLFKIKDVVQINAIVKSPLVILFTLLAALVLNLVFAYYKTEQKSEQMQKIEHQLQSERSK